MKVFDRHTCSLFHINTVRLALVVDLDMRTSGATENDLLARLAADARIPLDAAALRALVADPASFTGAAGNQVDAFVERAAPWLQCVPEAAQWSPRGIL